MENRSQTHHRSSVLRVIEATATIAVRHSRDRTQTGCSEHRPPSYGTRDSGYLVPGCAARPIRSVPTLPVDEPWTREQPREMHPISTS